MLLYLAQRELSFGVINFLWGLLLFFMKTMQMTPNKVNLYIYKVTIKQNAKFKFNFKNLIY
jgi:hypothetical protein